MVQKYAYWVSTGLLALLYLAGATYYFSDLAGVRQAFAALGYPPYLVPILGVAKLLGAIVILWRFSVALSDLDASPGGEQPGEPAVAVRAPAARQGARLALG